MITSKHKSDGLIIPLFMPVDLMRFRLYICLFSFRIYYAKSWIAYRWLEPLYLVREKVTVFSYVKDWFCMRLAFYIPFSNSRCKSQGQYWHLHFLTRAKSVFLGPVLHILWLLISWVLKEYWIFLYQIIRPRSICTGFISFSPIK